MKNIWISSKNITLDFKYKKYMRRSKDKAKWNIGLEVQWIDPVEKVSKRGKYGEKSIKGLRTHVLILYNNCINIDEVSQLQMGD